MKLLRSNTARLLALLIVIAAGAGLQLAYDFRQGVDLDNATVLEVTFDHPETVQTVTRAANEAHVPVRMDRTGDASFRLYYQNRSPEEIESVRQRLEENLGTITQHSVYQSIPGTSFVVSQSRCRTLSGFLLPRSSCFC
ncbi:MAG: hypothetical protein TR69_WS6001001471 [candidate division WS6 bacterium OLB20]|uniref:Uncharacterized protein n=1 Tax=candidate division WS6 bacterium OLB20 TaxID=1617426 RepID=A0A136LW46_9BACT|nr:MAG: hypothetical protein TR69_WS6001001471 [candidate division WS6 bacterium OLB20]